MRSRFSTCELEGLYSFRHVDLDCVIELEYDREGYMTIKSMQVWSSRRNQMVPASERLIYKFEGEKWAFLYEKCLQDYDRMCRVYRDERRDNARKDYQMRREIA